MPRKAAALWNSGGERTEDRVCSKVGWVTAKRAVTAWKWAMMGGPKSGA